MPRPLHPAQIMARKYWLGLSIAWGIGLLSAAVLPEPWVYVAVGVVLGFFLLFTLAMGQLKPVLEGRVFVNSASFGLLIIIFVALAVASRNIASTPLMWLAGAALGLVGGFIAFRSLNTRGRFVAPAALMTRPVQPDPRQRDL